MKTRPMVEGGTALRLFHPTVVALLCSFWSSPTSAEDVVNYLGGKAGKQTIRRTGQIEDYGGAGLVMVTSQGRKETIPLEKLVDFQTTATDEESLGDKQRAEGKVSEAVEAYLKARRAESRKWVQRRITSRLVDCYDVAGQIDKAGDEFLSIVSADPETPYFALLPLAWPGTTAGEPAVTRAAKWLGSSEPAAQLLGASWLLAGAERQKAIGVLKTLATDLDPRIAHLASAQLWRSTLVTASAADLQKWQQQIQRMPEEIRAGPLLVLGEGLARTGQSDDALLAYLQTPLVYHDRQTLSAAGLRLAAKAMEKAGRKDDAERLQRELQAKYPALAK